MKIGQRWIRKLKLMEGVAVRSLGQKFDKLWEVRSEGMCVLVCATESESSLK